MMSIIIIVICLVFLIILFSIIGYSIYDEYRIKENYVIIGNRGGMFSNFFKILDWLIYRENNSYKPVLYVYFRDKGQMNEHDTPKSKYHPINEIIPEINLWEKLFQPINAYDSYELLKVKHTKKYNFVVDYPYYVRYKGQPDMFKRINKETLFMDPRVYEHTNFPQVRNVYNRAIKQYIIPTLEFQTEINKKLTEFQEWKSKNKFKKILGCHVRYPGHFEAADKINMDNIYEQIMKEFKKGKNGGFIYDALMLCTQYKPCKDYIEKKIPRDKLYQETCKNLSEDDWAAAGKNYLEEIKDAYMDIYLLSQCDYLMGGTSNMFIGALCLNPGVKFELFDELKNTNGK